MSATADASASEPSRVAAPVTPPKQRPAENPLVQKTPLAARPGSGFANEATNKADLKRDSPRAQQVWVDSAMNNFHGMVDTLSLIQTRMRPPADEEEPMVARIVRNSATMLAKARYTLDHATSEELTKEKFMIQSFIDYVNAIGDVVLGEGKVAVDSQTTSIPPLDPREHATAPDVFFRVHEQVSDDNAVPTWPGGAAVAEFKARIRMFIDEAGCMNLSVESKEASVQMQKNGRSLLRANGRCVSWTIEVWEHRNARLFCFDRSGFAVSSKFDWLNDEEHILPMFFNRLYNPAGCSRRINGDDLTIQPVADRQLRERIYKTIMANDFYAAMLPSLDDVTGSTLRIQAALRDNENREGNPILVECFTIGEPLSICDGLYGRATRVYRVILARDVNRDDSKGKGKPAPIYALKDAWREACRRPEADFYDFIAAKTEPERLSAAGMVVCHGSIDLDRVDSSGFRLHVTHNVPDGKNYDHHHRIHTRILLSPVGSPLCKFTSTLALAKALEHGVIQHQIAFDAGVMHRDVSEGNLLFVEETPGDQIARAFLADWDYAEFTPAAAEEFNHLFPKRTKVDEFEVDKSLKDMTGTRPFLAIEILRTSGTTDAVKHASHHDLESFYWLLIWMVLRHTVHQSRWEEYACGKLFDCADENEKVASLGKDVPVPESNAGFCALASSLQVLVRRQNPPKPKKKSFLVGAAANVDDKPPAANNAITHKDVLEIFQSCFDEFDWPFKNTGEDKAIVYVPPPTSLQVAAGGSTIPKTGDKRSLEAVDEGVEVSESKKAKLAEVSGRVLRSRSKKSQR
ncbi:SNF2 superfamily protein [Mycena chlorophos]|uniref:SNF2 superfamily protein n=1 Tax=Mycena chlorophos TaxID=658473 RepID=A0A8H6TT07_MYCCL|nr:SNF2 superfamily protein [Mycena chlorophos]